MQAQAKDDREGSKWDILEEGTYVQPAPVVAEEPVAGTALLRPPAHLGYNYDDDDVVHRRASGPLMLLPGLGLLPRDDTRLDPGAGSRYKLGSTVLVNPASGMRQPDSLGADGAPLTRARQLFKDDGIPQTPDYHTFLHHVDTTFHDDTSMRQPHLSRLRGDATSSLRGKSIGLINASSLRAPEPYRVQPAAEITRFRGMHRADGMLMNESIRPDIAQHLPSFAQEPRPAPTRNNDLVKAFEQTFDEGSLSAVRRNLKDVDTESHMCYTQPSTHDDKRFALQAAGARDILAPTDPGAYRPLQDLPGIGEASRFAPAASVPQQQQGT
jgi:hypothetical protein